MRWKRFIAATLWAAALSCASPGSAPAPSSSGQPETGAAPSSTTFASGPGAGTAHPPRWQERFDFDGDGRPDRVEVDFSGGAHCCYRIAVTLGDGKRIELPFELDGGYVGGLDLSQPDRFDVLVGADGRAALRVEIATYDGEPRPIPPAWTKELGVRSHRIAVRFDGSRPHVANLGWRCDMALVAVKHRTWAAWEGLPEDCTLDKIMDVLLGARISHEPVLLGAGRGPAVLVRLELASSQEPHLDVAVAGGSVVCLSPAPGSGLDPNALGQAFGESALQLDLSGSGGHRDWVWPARGLSVRTDRGGRAVGLTLFAATDLDRYRREVAPPVRP